MTQEELQSYLKDYFTRVPNAKQNDIDIATSQALAQVDGLMLWLRERDSRFIRK